MYWTFAINKDFYFGLKENTEIKWNSAKEVRKGDIILIYTGAPYSSIGFILKAISNPFEDPEIRKNWKRPAIMVEKLVEIPNAIELSDLKENQILNEWGAVKFNFRGSHFKMTDYEWEEMKKLILAENPELKNEIEDLDTGINIKPKPPSPKIWKIAPGSHKKRQKIWPVFLEKGYIGVGWFGCESFIKKSYSQFETYEKLREELRKCSNTPAIGNNAKMIWYFGTEIKIGDYVVVNNGIKGIWGIGKIKSDYIPPRESIKLNIDEDEEYFHFRKVDWIIDEPIVIKEDNFFAQQTITPLNSDQWKKIKDAYIKKNPDYKKVFKDFENEINTKSLDDGVNLIRKLYDEFNKSYLSKDEGKKHESLYSKERQEVLKYYNIIKDDPEIFNNLDDPIINYILPIKRFSVAPAGFNDIKAVRRGEENLTRFSKSVYGLIKNLITTDNFNKQKELIKSFKMGDSKGIQSGVFTSVLYFLNHEYYYINKKTVKTFNLISEILGLNMIINGNLTDYIDNLKKLKNLINKVSIYVPELGEFEIFDIFCHWMCDPNLGAYAIKRIKFDLFKYQNLNLKISFEILLNNYIKAKEKKLPKDEILLIKDLMTTSLPESLSDLTKGYYKIFSSSWDKWHYCPYFAVMNEKITIKHSEGIFVNYMFREDMSGIYLALRQAVQDITQPDYKSSLNIKSEEYRNKLSTLNQNFELSNEIDLKSSGKFAPFYEAANIYSKFYPADDLPSEEKLKSDLEEILKIYDELTGILKTEFKSFNEYLNLKNFLYKPEIVENFLLSLSVKPFVILTGSSGTGKTKIAQLFAEYLQKKNKGDYVIIPVGANWSENRHLMGFYNVITRDYESTPALDLIVDAHNNPEKVYFLILDEMNLSHVERYFSDFLSAMESGKEIELYSKHKTQDIKNKIIPQKLKIPDNLLVVGTVNVDETTYMFSPKVLDRANTIEFTTYPAHDYIMGNLEYLDPEGNMDLLENPLSYLNNRDINIAQLKDLLTHVQIKNGDNLWPTLAHEIHTFQDTLKMAGFDFGFRVINEIIRFMYMAWLYEGLPPVWDNWERYFDAQIMQKMLPKIHGSQRELEVLLEELFKLTYNDPYTDTPWVSLKLDEYKCKYPSSALKIQSLGRSLQEKRYASFTG